MTRRVALNPNPKLQGPRPHLWRTGTDPRRHDQFIAFARHRAQCTFRDEEFNLTFEDWETLWNTNDAWSKRGRKADSVNLCRVDVTRPWQTDNCALLVRKDQIVANGAKKKGTTYKRKTDES